MRREAEDKRQMMEETPMGRLLWKMSGPSVIGIMAYNLYNVFDTAFVKYCKSSRSFNYCKKVFS